MRRSFHDDDLEARFRQRGWVLVDLLDDRQVAKLLSVFDSIAHLHWEGISQTILTRDVEARRAVHRDASAILGPALARFLDDFPLCHTGFVAKSPGSDRSGMPLHQDHSWVEEPDVPAVTVWCPLTDVGPDNGWLGVVDGSHHLRPGHRVGTPFAWPEMERTVEEHFLDFYRMRAGQALLMHPGVFHMSPPNASGSARVVAAGMAAPSEATLYYGYWDHVAHPERIELYEVDADFYQRHMMGTRPDLPGPERIIPRNLRPLERAELEALRPSAVGA